MKIINSKNKTNTFKKHGMIKEIIKWYRITMAITIQRISVINFKPTKNLKQLKKLLNILSTYYKICKNMAFVLELYKKL